MDSQDRKYTCKKCNKNYSCYKSLWNHNKKFHIKDVSKNTPIVSTDSPNVSIKNSLLCKYCAKKFSSTQNKWKHENKVCKKKKEINKIELLQAQVNELTSKINSTTNINNNNNNGTINNNNNNGTINNNIIIGFGKEDVAKLTVSEKKKIIGKGYQAVLALIDTMHFNKKYPEFNNIQITNLRDNCAKIYDDDINDYKTVKKKETIDQLIYNKTFNLGDILEELNDPENKYHKITLKLIDMLQSYSPEMEDKDSLEFYKNLCKDIIFLIYNKTKLLQVTKV
jgi:hypothetical protein